MSLPPAEQPKPVATRADRDRERHARKIARAALEQLGFPTSRLRLLHDGQNTTYRVDAPDGPHALRVTRPGVGLPHVEGELAWTAALDRDTTLTLCAPQAWTTVQERVCVMTRWVPGVSRTKSLSASMLRAVGAVMAELHEHGHGWRPPPGWARPRLETVWLEAPSPLPLLPSPARETFARCEQRLRPVLARLFDEPTHVLHADLHQGNYRFRPGHRVGVIDFDSCAVGHPAQDIAICLYYVLRHPRYARLRPAF
ncbi:MAG: phosphotransferase, partial [Nannocystaceae bacterium]